MILGCFSSTPWLYSVDDLILSTRDGHKRLLWLLGAVTPVSLAEIHEISLHLWIKLETDSPSCSWLLAKVSASWSIWEFVALPKTTLLWSVMVSLLLHRIRLGLLAIIGIASREILITWVRGILEIEDSLAGHMMGRSHLYTIVVSVVVNMNLLYIQCYGWVIIVDVNASNIASAHERYYAFHWLLEWVKEWCRRYQA